jgi:hypothetical protein
MAGSNAFWTAQDKDKLLDLLFECKASAGDGGNFKEAIFQVVSEILTPFSPERSTKDCQSLPK